MSPETVNLLNQSPHTLMLIDADRRQRRIEELRIEQIIEADDRQLLRDPPPRLQRRLQSAQGSSRTAQPGISRNRVFIV